MPIGYIASDILPLVAIKTLPAAVFMFANIACANRFMPEGARGATLYPKIC
jgi:hypothetical protein